MNTNTSETPQKPRRGKDFAIGFFGTIFGSILAGCVCMGISYLSMIASTIVAIFIWIAPIYAILWAFRNNRRNLAFGILTVAGISIAIPLLLFGACAAFGLNLGH